jgi:NAD(P)-dependent dehydrogenase (short-subunit alcohol dehydrogenase family)
MHILRLIRNLLGGASGIGLASAVILARKGATVHVLDLNPIEESDNANIAPEIRDSIKYTYCDITKWASLRDVFETVGHVDIAIANAGVTEEKDYFADSFDADGKLEEPGYAVVEVNYRSVLNFVKLSLSAFRKQGPGGSLVITSSATAYSPEQNLPVYSATKLGVSRDTLYLSSFR